MNNNNTLNRLLSITDFFGDSGNLKVVVPKIQRAYAQGRSKEINLRTQFVNALFNSIENDIPIELSFIYGAKSEDKDGAFRYELLDGQQRITTLILLYWYIASAENVEVPGFIKSFTYETRTTSTNFLEKLSKNTIRINHENPSSIIRACKWYTISFDKDSSVNGMMNMLDTIHLRYCKSDKKGTLYSKLSNLKFYELNLDEFGLTEEIYIKMNARGLQLTPFENFKADLIKFMKRDDAPMFQETVVMDTVGNPKVSYFLNFSQKLDNRWLNFFWRETDKTGRNYCNRYFRFFYRFFATKVFLEYCKDLNAQEFRPKSEGTIWDFFWRVSPTQDKTYLGFERYEEMLNARPDYLRIIEKILDWLTTPGISALLDEVLCEPWNVSVKYDIFKFEERYRLPDAVLFAAICEYVERSESFDEQNFRRWIRIVLNAINDSLFRNVNEIVTLSRNFVKLLELPGATSDIYKAIANGVDGNIPRNIRESILKAQIIVNNPDMDWESAFIKAESHPFFAGSIGFLLKNLPDNPQDFTHRCEVAGQFFNANGMTDAAKSNHRLIRSFVRQLNTKAELLDSTISERRDNENHLRAFLLEKDCVSSFLCKLCDMENAETAYHYIDSIVDTEPNIGICTQSLFDEEDEMLKRAFRRICLDNKIYDYIAKTELSESRYFFDFMARNGNYTIDRRRSWWDRIYLGSDRRIAIKKLLELEYRFKTGQEAQYDFVEQYGDVYESDVWMYKEFGENRSQLQVHFFHNGNVNFCIDIKDGNAKRLFETLHPDTDENLCFGSSCVTDRADIENFIARLTEYEESFIRNIGKVFIEDNQ